MHLISLKHYNTLQHMLLLAPLKHMYTSHLKLHYLSLTSQMSHDFFLCSVLTENFFLYVLSLRVLLEFRFFFYLLSFLTTILQDMLGAEQAYEGLYGQGPPSVHSSHGGRPFQQGMYTSTHCTLFLLLIRSAECGRHHSFVYITFHNHILLNKK